MTEPVTGKRDTRDFYADRAQVDQFELVGLREVGQSGGVVEVHVGVDHDRGCPYRGIAP